MGLVESYRIVKNSIVAFAAKYVPVLGDDKPPDYPPIIGTGFVIREDGLIVTNAHVVRLFSEVFRPRDVAADDWAVQAHIFKRINGGVMDVPLDVIGVATPAEFEPQPLYYGPKEGPDLALVQVRARGLPPVVTDFATEVVEGMEIGTAGFPMGSDALTAPGWLHQLTPTLQAGIISAVLPFACKVPHAFAVNVMVQGGASGSPVFLAESGAVIGILYASLNDSAETRSGDLHDVPTNISFVVPSHYLGPHLDSARGVPELGETASLPTLDEIIAATRPKEPHATHRWITKTADPDFEKKRLGPLRRASPKGRDQ